MMSRFTYWSAGVLLSVMAVGTTEAQTRFEWPSKQADVETYKLWDRCSGAANRVYDSVSGVGVLRDTLPFSQRGPFRLRGKDVVNSAQRCASSIPLSSVSISNTLLAQSVLLMANRDAEIIPLYRKRLDSASTDSLKIDVITSTVNLLMDALPARLSLADSLLTDIQPYDGQWVTKDKLDMLGAMCRLADVARNATLLTKYCGGFLRTVDNLTDAEHARYGPPLAFAYAGFTRYLKRSEMQDSLAKSSQAYVSLAREILTKAFRGWSGNQVLGEKAVPIVGDFWFPESAKSASYPRPGKITLVTMVAMSAWVGPSQIGTIASLRRLAARFPDLDIIAVSGTTGHFGVLAPPTPAVEAELNYRRIVDFYKVPLVMAVTTSPMWRLSDPDRRRIFDPYPHNEMYAKLYSTLISVEYNPMTRLSGWTGESDGGRGLLVDADGIIVDYIQSEEELATNIGILKQRAKQ